MKMRFIKVLMMLILIVLINLVFVEAQENVTIPATPYYYANPTADPWSQVSWSQDYCNKTGMDFLVVLEPTACSPTPVTSDLLEEQDVPVMCRLTGIKINPLIQVPYIKSIVVGVENKSKEVSFVSFYPAKSLLTQSYFSPTQPTGFEGVPTMNNLGYLWIQLARQPVEAKMPESVKINANAIITYDVARTYGINENQFVLPILSQEEWFRDYKQYSFWRGKGYVRLMNITGRSTARIAVYTQPRAIPQTIDLRVGDVSQEILLPGFYCGAGVKIRLDSLARPTTKARILVNGNEEILAAGEKIADSECEIGWIKSSLGYGGTVAIKCRGTPPSRELTIKDFGATLEIEDYEKATENVPERREQEIVAGSHIALKKSDGSYYHLYTAFIGKLLDAKLGIIGNVITFERNAKEINKKEVDKVVSAVHDYMKAQRGDALGIAMMAETDLNKALKEYLKRRGINRANDYNFLVWKKGFGETFDDIKVNVVDVEGPEQASYSPEIEKAFKEAIDKWQAIAHEYSMKPSPEGSVYGVRALHEAANLAAYMHKMSDEAELLKLLIDKYGASDEPEIVNEVEWAREELRRTIASGSGDRRATFLTPSGSYEIELIGIEKTGAIEYVILELEKAGEKTIGQYSTGDEIDGWELNITSENTIELTNIDNASKILPIAKGGWGKADDVRIRVLDIVQKLEAKVTVLPLEKERKTEANFTVQIGIEKRAIKLSPQQTRELIAKLDRMINQLKGINDKLGNMIKWWKKACFVTASTLWLKNFVTGLGGEALARKIVMESWSEKCSDPAFRKQVQEEKGIQPGFGQEVITVEQCYREKQGDINKDIALMKTALDKSNKFIEQIKSKEGVVRSGGLFGLIKAVNDERFIEESQKLLNCEKLGEDDCTPVHCVLVDGICKFKEIKEYELKEGELVETGRKVNSSLVISKLSELHKHGWLFRSDVKDIYRNYVLYDECVKQAEKSPLCDSILKSTYIELSNYQKHYEEIKVAEEAKEVFGEIIPYSRFPKTFTPPAKIFVINPAITPQLDKWFDSKLVEKLKKSEGRTAALFGLEGVYWLAIVNRKGTENYYGIDKTATTPIPLTLTSEKKYREMNETEKEKIKDSIDKINQLSEVQEINLAACEGNYAVRGPEAGDPVNVIKFWENYPHHGVAYMQLGNGWYLATTPESWKESGDLAEVIICNVGEDGIPNFDFSKGTGLGDDAQCCFRIPLTVGVVPEAIQAHYEKAKSCAKEAMTKFKAGEREIKISGCLRTYKLGKPPAAKPSVQCENFMSPTDCNIIYNVCDPVMCPNSRCDFAGRIPVDNVAQSGVIGSIMLCLPNFEGGKGVLVPICLTGVWNGIDYYITVLNATKTCLEEQLKTGRMVGICDYMMSLYLCRLFWQEFEPFIKAGLPTISESLLHRGGGEYAFFSESWKQSLEAARYFTEYYGQQTFTAFKERSTAEIETEICKKFVGVAYPTQAKFWEELSKPESFTQATACFQETPLGGPSTDSHYKVHFIIKASNDIGAYYQVWLRRPPEPGFAPPSPEFLVPQGTGYIAAGQFVDMSPDFKAPSGYKEIVIRINEQEISGFGDCASTEFALNQLQNYYLESQIKEKITTAKECSEGTPTIFPTPAITQNIQSAVEHALEPQIYRRGIVRICAGQNPGGGVEDANWKRVGYCDNKEIGCYLYLPSINESITDLGIRKELYSYAENEAIKDAITRLGLDDRNTSQEYLEMYEPSINYLAKNIDDKLTELRKGIENGTITKKAYLEAIGYSLEKDSKEWWLSLWGKTEKFIETMTRVRNKCAHPDEKVRADWQIAKLLELKVKLLSLVDLIELEKAKEVVEEKIKISEKEIRSTKKLAEEYRNTLYLFKRWPTLDYTVTSCYGPRKIDGVETHRGIDIRTKGTSGEIYAVADGIVQDVGYYGSYGNTVIISHAKPGYPSEFSTLYAHLSKIEDWVVKGAEIKEGEIIGYAGKTGRAEEEHLHFEVLITDKYLPFCFFDKSILRKIELKPNAKQEYKGDKQEVECNTYKEVDKIALPGGTTTEIYYFEKLLTPYCEKELGITAYEGQLKEERKKCAKGDGWWGLFTDASDCHKAGSNCFFKKGLLDNDCLSCSDLEKCSDLNDDEEMCKNEECLIAGGVECKWNNETKKCVELSVIEKELIKRVEEIEEEIKKDKNSSELLRLKAEIKKILQSVAFNNLEHFLKDSLNKSLQLSLKKINTALSTKMQEEWQAFVKSDAEKLIREKYKADCADFAITLLYDFAQKTCSEIGMKPNVTLYSTQGTAFSSELNKLKNGINAQALATKDENAETILSKPDTKSFVESIQPGDFISYNKDRIWDTVVFVEKEDVGTYKNRKIYRYHIPKGNLEKETATKIIDYWAIDFNITAKSIEEGKVEITKPEWKKTGDRGEIIRVPYERVAQEYSTFERYFRNPDVYALRRWKLSDVIECQ